MKKVIAFIVMFLCLGNLPILAEDVQKMNKDTLKAILASPELVLLDVRQGRDWSSSEFKIKGAVRAASDEFDTWSTNLPKDKKIVLYCA